jgi:putative acetyltransferase
MVVQRERAEHHEAVAAVVESAFLGRGRRAPAEARLLRELRRCDGWIPQLSLVALDSRDRVAGHVLCTRATVDAHPALGLGPLSVRPSEQRSGVGSALMHAVLAAADALDEPVVVLLGDPAYYSRFGFRPAAQLGITSPHAEWVDHLQARGLSARQAGEEGMFEYAEPFNRM